jgi:predicted MFS family arabinose efflux permease
VTLASVLALDSADMGAVGAMAIPLQEALHIGKAELGLILTLSSASSAVTTLLFGYLVDRTNRTKLLRRVLWLWALGIGLCGCATSYAFLLVARIGLGAVIAASVPVVASLIGDYVPPRARGEVYGFILSGEFIGTAIGLVVAGELGGLSWRLGFWVLVLPVPVLVWALRRLPEPERGGGSYLERVDRAPRPIRGEEAQTMRERIRASGVEPRERRVPEEDPRSKSLAWAVLYVLRIPSNVVLIVSSALGYFFFAGLRAFGVEYLSASFGVPHAGAIMLTAALGTGAMLGVFTGGKLGDWLIAKGRLRGRVLVGTLAYFVSAALFSCGLLAPSAWPRGVLFFFATFALGAVNPALDSARLDIMHPGLWGRAEATRMTLRKISEAGAPVLFGFVAGPVFGGGLRGLRDGFLVMLVPLFASAFVAAFALRTYLRDAATAAAYAERTRGGGSPCPPSPDKA